MGDRSIKLHNLADLIYGQGWNNPVINPKVTVLVENGNKRLGGIGLLQGPSVVTTVVTRHVEQLKARGLVAEEQHVVGADGELW